ncbi:DUF7546 family protein [Halalkalirubrum salinum]|uniref:DUF7546 family protein n=1 Tax=Halalkalirubrum salinum TaxID=2563889 RepID=UPI0010FBA5F4|nr:hypothetical protein [Halalkalirubrum salinum]
MSASALPDFVRDTTPLQRSLAVAVAVAVAVVASIAGYLQAASPAITDYRSLVYPVVWIVGGSAATVWVHGAVPVRSNRALAVIISSGYVTALLWVSGLIRAGAGMGSLSISPAIPGWGPIVVYEGSIIGFSVVPFKWIGYLALGYIVYVLVAGAGGSIKAAALGFVTCVSCTAPLVGSVVGAIGGAGASRAVATAGYDIATVVFLVTIGLLVFAVARTTATCSVSETSV